MSYLKIVASFAVIFFVSACDAEQEIQKTVDQEYTSDSQIQFLTKLEETETIRFTTVIDDQLLAKQSPVSFSIDQPQADQKVYDEQGCIAVLAGQTFEVRIDPDLGKLDEVWITLDTGEDVNPWEGGSVGAKRRTMTPEYDLKIVDIQIILETGTFGFWGC